MKMISSKITDPKSSGLNWFARIEIENDSIINVYGRNSRVWGDGFEAEPLQDIMFHIAKHWPNLYKFAREAAPNSNLIPLIEVKRRILKQEIRKLSDDMAPIKKKYDKLMAKRRAKEAALRKLRNPAKNKTLFPITFAEKFLDKAKEKE